MINTINVVLFTNKARFPYIVKLCYQKIHFCRYKNAFFKEVRSQVGNKDIAFS